MADTDELVENVDKPTKKEPSLIMKIGMAILFIGAFFFFTFLENGQSVPRFLAWIKWMFLYVAIVFLLSFFQKYKAFRVIHNIASTPIAVVVLLAPLFESLSAIFVAFLSVLMFATGFFVLIPTQLLGYQVQDSTSVFVVLTVTAILITSCGNWIIKVWHDIQGREEKEQLKKMSLRILNQKKARFLIFLTYFLALLVFNISNFNGAPFWGDEALSTSILQSFATFVAYDRLVITFKSL